MSYNFDEIICRKDTNSTNYEGWKSQVYIDKNCKESFRYSENEIIRMWVADMDFATPPEVLNAIRDRLDARILGYSQVYDESYWRVLEKWFLKHYKWQIKTEHLVFSPGVVPALNRLVGLLTEADENVLISTPSYTPFQSATLLNNRQIFYNALVKNNGTYEIDFDDLTAQISDPSKNIKLFILCNPHNPTGRVWSKNELLRLGEICLKQDIWIISDEIHCDLLRIGKKHIPLASLFPGSDKIITCTAPSKTFNMAGNVLSHLFIPNQTIRNKWQHLYNDLLSPLSIAATKAAYEKGEKWLEALKTYLDESFVFLKEKLKEELPLAKFTVPESTYLAWVDISAYQHKISKKESIAMFIAKNAGVIIEDNNRFVANSEGHIRINIACPRVILEKGVTRIAQALNY